MKTETQKKENAEKFCGEIKELAKKYGAEHLSLCCNIDEKFLGIIGIDVVKSGDFFEATLNVARLYQSGREKIKILMDDYA